MKSSRKIWVLAASAAVCTASLAHADPLVNVQVLGSTTNGSGYASTVTGVTPGETVYYEVVEQLAPAGSINNSGYNSPPPYVMGSSQTNGTDGVNTLSFNLNDAAGASLPTPSLASGWASPPAATAGTASGSSVNGIFAAQPAGVFAGANAQSVMLTGSFTASSSVADVLSAMFDSTIHDAGGFQFFAGGGVNQQVGVFVSDQTETLNGAASSGSLPYDPYIGFTPLTIAGPAAIPAPGVVPALGALISALGVFGFVRGRRQIA